MPLTNGQMLQGRYRVVKLLGQGGMGAVYKAWDTRLMNVALCERGYQGSMQQFERGFMLRTDLDAIYVCYENGKWEHWQNQ